MDIKQPSIYQPTEAAMSSGMMKLHSVTGEPCFTDAGLFAAAGSLAFSDDTDEEQRIYLTGCLDRVLTVAIGCGLDEQTKQIILWAFSSGISPTDGSEEGLALAKLCRLVAGLIGIGRMSQIIGGNQSH